MVMLATYLHQHERHAPGGVDGLCFRRLRVISVTADQRPHHGTFDGPFDLSDLAVVQELRRVLERHDFTAAAIAEAVGPPLPVGGTKHQREDMPLYVRRVEAPTPINTLVKLFVLDHAVEPADVAVALAPLGLGDLQDLGLIEVGTAGVRARVRLSTYEGLVLAHDGNSDELRAPRPDHVLDVNPTTVSLANLTVRRTVERALEIGTGCGALALLASRHAGRVVATDTNPRALNLAAFNAALNGVTNVDWRLGSLFDAVEGERFDLFFCNPPFVISPDSTFIFRDAGRRGDALCEEIVRRAPAYLNDGGFATVLLHWAIRHGEEWHAPLRRWVTASACDAWLKMGGGYDPLSYAALWARSRDRDVYVAALDRWMRYYRELGLRAVGNGAVVLRKTSKAQPWVRADRVPYSATTSASAQIEQLFASEDRLIGLSDEAVLAETFRASPHHALLQTCRPAVGGGYAVDQAELRSLGGLPFRSVADARSMDILARADGTRALSAIVTEIAAVRGLDTQQFAIECVATVRQLAAFGFLV